MIVWKREIILAETYIRLPKSSFSWEIVTIHFNDIIQINFQTINHQKLFDILYSRSKVTVSEKLMPKGKFEEVFEMLQGIL